MKQHFSTYVLKHNFGMKILKINKETQVDFWVKRVIKKRAKNKSDVKNER